MYHIDVRYAHKASDLRASAKAISSFPPRAPTAPSAAFAAGATAAGETSGWTATGGLAFMLHDSRVLRRFRTTVRSTVGAGTPSAADVVPVPAAGAPYSLFNFRDSSPVPAACFSDECTAAARTTEPDNTDVAAASPELVRGGALSARAPEPPGACDATAAKR